MKRVPPGVPVLTKTISITEYGGCSSIGRALDCGSRRCGFESHHPPHEKLRCIASEFFSYIRLTASDIATQRYLAGAKLYCPAGSCRGEYNITESFGFNIAFAKQKYSCGIATMLCLCPLSECSLPTYCILNLSTNRNSLYFPGIRKQQCFLMQFELQLHVKQLHLA